MKVPFVLEPRKKPVVERIGDEDIGVLEVVRRGYLNAGEKSFVNQIFTSDDSTVILIGLSRAVGAKYKIGLDEAYRAVLAVLGGTAETSLHTKIQKDFFNEINSALKGLAAIQSKEEMVYALCMFKYRVNYEATVEDLMSLHPELVTLLAQLYRDEEAKSTEKLEVKSNESDDQEEEDSVNVDRMLEVEEKAKKESAPAS